MRAPLQIQTPYEAALYEARVHFLALDDLAIDHIADIFVAAHEEISDVLGTWEATAGGLKYERLEAIADQLEDLIENMSAAVGTSIADDATVAAKIGATGHYEASIPLLENYGVDTIEKSRAMFATVPEDAIRSVFSRRYADGKAFSNRIWDLNSTSQTTIRDVIGKGLAQGKSARQITQDLHPHLRTIQFQGKRKTIDYRAYRLATTEINNAFRESTAISADVAPWVEGVGWRLSGSHRVPDICDEWATQDIHGLGEGNYRSLDAPIDHPNGKCHLVDILVSRAELESILDGFAQRRAA